MRSCRTLPGSAGCATGVGPIMMLSARESRPASDVQIAMMPWTVGGSELLICCAAWFTRMLHCADSAWMPQIGHNIGFQAPISTRSAWAPSGSRHSARVGYKVV